MKIDNNPGSPISLETENYIVAVIASKDPRFPKDKIEQFKLTPELTPEPIKKELIEFFGEDNWIDVVWNPPSQEDPQQLFADASQLRKKFQTIPMIPVRQGKNQFEDLEFRPQFQPN